MNPDNRPKPGVSHPDNDSQVLTGATGKATTDGYVVQAVRPRTPFTNRSVDPKLARKIERNHGRFSTYD